MDKLLPCPICGGEARQHNRVNANTVTCQSCGLMVKQSGPREGDAAKKWNTRHTPEGWRLVPDEATRAQESEAEDYWQSKRFAAFSDDPRTWAGVYQAMLAAAPKWGGE